MTTPPLPKIVTLSAGATFRHYEILSEINRGGMGVVFKARDTRLNRIIALKILQPAGASALVRSPQEAVQRFWREAGAIAKLRHPNIVAIHEVDLWEGYHYFAMEFIDGIPLDALLRQRTLAPDESARIIGIVAEAVGFANRHGIVHRDLKPGNILIDSSGVPHVTDFGLARDVATDLRITQSGVTLGTPPYMPPEQARGQLDDLDDRADVYALGATLYEMLTGRPPHLGESGVETLLQVLDDDPVPVRRRNPHVHADLARITHAALAKDRDDRYQSCFDLAADLGHYLRGEYITVHPRRMIARIWRFVTRYDSTILALLLLISLVVSIGTWVQGLDAPRREWRAFSTDAVDDAHAASRWQMVGARGTVQVVPGAWSVLSREPGSHAPMIMRRLLDGTEEGTLEGNVRFDVGLAWYTDDLQNPRAQIGIFFGGAQRTAYDDGYATLLDASDGVVLTKAGRVIGKAPYAWRARRIYRLEVSRQLVGSHNTVTVAIDGRQLISYAEDEPIYYEIRDAYGITANASRVDVAWIDAYCQRRPLNVGRLEAGNRQLNKAAGLESEAIDLAERAQAEKGADATDAERAQWRAEAIARFDLAGVYYSTAIGEFQDIIDEFPGTADAMRADFQFALCLKKQADLGFARNARLERNPSVPASVADRYRRAARRFEDHITRFPDSPDVSRAHYHAAICRAVIGEHTSVEPGQPGLAALAHIEAVDPAAPVEPAVRRLIIDFLNDYARKTLGETRRTYLETLVRRGAPSDRAAALLDLSRAAEPGIARQSGAALADDLSDAAAIDAISRLLASSDTPEAVRAILAEARARAETHDRRILDEYPGEAAPWEAAGDRLFARWSGPQHLEDRKRLSVQWVEWSLGEPRPSASVLTRRLTRQITGITRLLDIATDGAPDGRLLRDARALIERRKDPILRTALALALAERAQAQPDLAPSLAALLAQPGAAPGDDPWWSAALADGPWWAPVLLDPLGTGPLRPRADWLVRLSAAPAEPRDATALLGAPVLVQGSEPLPPALVWRLGVEGARRATRPAPDGEHPADATYAGAVALLVSATAELDLGARAAAAAALRDRGLGEPAFTVLACFLLERATPVADAWIAELSSFRAAPDPGTAASPAPPMALAVGALRATPADRELWLAPLRIVAPMLAEKIGALPPA